MASFTEMFLEDLTSMDVIRKVLLVQLQEIDALKGQVEYLTSDRQFCVRSNKKLETVKENDEVSILKDEVKVLKDEVKKMCMRVASLEKTCADQKVQLQEIVALKGQVEYLTSDRHFCDRSNKKQMAKAVKEAGEEVKVLKDLKKMFIKVASLEKNCADQKKSHVKQEFMKRQQCATQTVGEKSRNDNLALSKNYLAATPGPSRDVQLPLAMTSYADLSSKEMEKMDAYRNTLPDFSSDDDNKFEWKISLASDNDRAVHTATKIINQFHVDAGSDLNYLRSTSLSFDCVDDDDKMLPF